jgi:putative oxidoreductase
MQFLEKLKPLGLLVLRLAVGATFLFHGYEKLHDLPYFLKAFPGYGFPSYFAYISGVLEVFGGGILVLGLFTRGIALLLTIEMGLVLGRTLIPQVGIYDFKQYQVALLLGAASLALATTGARKCDRTAVEIDDINSKKPFARRGLPG